MRLLTSLIFCLCLSWLTSCASVTAVPEPAIIPTSSWGGIPGPAPAQPQAVSHISHITLHHQGETWVEGRDVPSYLRRLQQWSRETKHWADIPYHYVIAPDGQIYAARPEAQAGDTNTEYDPRGHVLIMVLGNFEEVEPNAAELRSTVALMAWLAQRHGLTAAAIASHKDFSSQTVCPGRNLYRYLQSGWIQSAVTAKLDGKELPLPLPLPPPAQLP